MSFLSRIFKQKPPIPSTDDMDALIDWFLEFEVDLSEFRVTGETVRDNIRRGVLASLQDAADASSLREAILSGLRYCGALLPEDSHLRLWNGGVLSSEETELALTTNTAIFRILSHVHEQRFGPLDFSLDPHDYPFRPKAIEDIWDIPFGLPLAEVKQLYPEAERHVEEVDGHEFHLFGQCAGRPIDDGGLIERVSVGASEEQGAYKITVFFVPGEFTLRAVRYKLLSLWGRPASPEPDTDCWKDGLHEAILVTSSDALFLDGFISTIWKRGLRKG